MRPPRSIEGKNLEYSEFEDSLHVSADSGSTIQIAEWTSDSAPSRDQCSATVTARGSDTTGSLSAGSQVCGITPEGRTFLIKVTRKVAGYKLFARATVWAP